MMKQGLKYDFTVIALLLIPIGVAINFISNQLAQILRIPLHLDVIGTIVVAMIGGPWIGAVTGLCTNLVNSITNPPTLFFTPVAIVIGLLIGYFSKWGMFTKSWKLIVSGVILTLVTIITVVPITVIAFGGATGRSTDAVTAVFLASGAQIWASVFSSSIFVEGTDKILSIVIAYIIVKKMSDRYLAKMNYGQNFISKKTKDPKDPESIAK